MIGSKPKKTILSRSEHKVSRKDIDPDALKVLYRLDRHGYTACLVGGGVRDLLLGRKPKDFDIGTTAHPNQVRKLFRNCFLVGRRFRLAHIRFGQKVIECSTFRRQPEPVDATNAEEASLYQHRDNTFGTPQEDAWRRDFTINGIFYDIDSFKVIDYVGGLRDLKKKVIRTIGDPNIRMREDPVRMLRAIRFASRLGFTIERRTWNAMRRHHAEILKASPERLYEEVQRLFAFGSGASAMQLLRTSGLLADLMPRLEEHLCSSRGAAREFWRYLESLDAQDVTRQNPTGPQIVSALCYPLFMEAVDDARADGAHVIAMHVAQEVVSDVVKNLSVPRRAMQHVIHVFDAQRRLDGWKQERFSKQRFVARECFLDAAMMYDVHCEALGIAVKHRPWMALYDQVKHDQGNGESPPQRSRPRRAPRRRRRGGRRTEGGREKAGTGI